MRPFRFQPIVLFTLSCFAWQSASSVIAGTSGSCSLLAMSGDALPDGSGVLATIFSAPALNVGGQVAFLSQLDGTPLGNRDDFGLFRVDAGAGLVTIARESEPAGDGVRFLSLIGEGAINNAGEVAFRTNLVRTPGGAFDSGGLFVGDGKSRLRQIARTGEVGPDGVGTISFVNPPSLNNRGQVAFSASYSPPLSPNAGLYRGDGQSTAIQLTGGERSSASGGNSSVPTFNELGEIAYYARIDDIERLLRTDGVGQATEIVRLGQPTPDGNGTVFTIGRPSLNDQGQVAFRAGLSGAAGPGSGIFIGDGESPLGQIVRSRTPSPDGNGVLIGFDNPIVNNSGEAGFFADLFGSDRGSAEDLAVFRGDAAGNLSLAARAGQVVPGGDSITDIAGFALNSAGQIAIDATLETSADPGAAIPAIFLYDDSLGLVEVARVGMPMMGSTVTFLRFSSQSIRNFSTDSGDEWSGLNDLGQVAFLFELANGDRGIALWTIPEPASAWLIATAVTFAALKRSRQLV